VRPVIAALGGAPPEAFWGATDLTPEIVADADARVSPAQFCIAWAELIRLTGDPQIALRISAATPPGAFGVVEYVCRAQPTLGDALRQWVRYLNLLDDAVVVGLVDDVDEAGDDRTCLRVMVESEAPAPASHELCFALVAAQARQLTAAPFRFIGVDFTHRAPGDVAAYRKWFDAPVRFGADATQLVMPRAALAAPLTTADPALATILARHADDLVARDPEGPPLTAQIKRALRTALRDDRGHVDLVARQVGLTARSLQRRLKDEGTSFNALREDVRRELATRYLDDNLSIAEISFLLGFSEPSAFFRAFKRWTGLTPVEARRRAAAPA
jgi:AraC-like DNA-binding protein